MSDSTRTITLTDRRPVKIQDSEWPLIASASDKDYDNQYEFQANRISNWFVGVRQHEDGRAIVYATYSYSSNYQGARNYTAKRGVLLGRWRPTSDDPNGVADAIRDVCEDIANAEHKDDDASRWPTLAAECIADLPAETI